MEQNWSLKEIYPSFESNEFINDLKVLEDEILNFKDFAKEVLKDEGDTLNNLTAFVCKNIEIVRLISKLEGFVSLSISTDTKNQVALRYSDILENKLTELVEASTALEKWVSSIENIGDIINSSELLKEHEFYLKEIIEKSKYLLSDNEETIISKMKNTGSNAWSKLKDNLISNLKVEIEEKGEIKELPLTVVLNMAYDSSKEVREKAYYAEIASYKKVEEGVAAALNGIKGEVLTVSALRGYKSPLHMTLESSRMDEDSLNAMLDAMKERMPIFRKYLRRKSELLGYKNGLPFYEMYAPVSQCEMKFTYEEGAKFIEKNFRTFSDNLADFSRRAVEKHWIDVMPKEGKVGGAFCHNLHFIGESRILLNYGEQFGDVVTMAHELGHGFHGECLKDEKVLNSDYPMPLAETASTFCETIIKKAAIKEATKEEALSILENEISDATQVIVDIYSRFLFEKALFEKRKVSALTVEEIKELMINAQKEAYGEGLDENFLHPYMWAWKPHYYSADYNYYNFPYAFGLLFAKGLYAEYLKKGRDFTKDYEVLLSITGKNKIADVTKSVGINIQNKEFWLSSLRTIEEDINEFLELTK